MAGNGNSGTSIPFRMSEAVLEKKIKEFRALYEDGSRGMVSWPLFCAFLGYSEDDVAECYQRGSASNCAYTGRAVLLKAFRTECKALTLRTCDKQQQLAKDEVRMDYLNPVADGTGDRSIHVLFGVQGDERWKEAME